MARHAALMQDGGYVLGIGYIARRSCPLNTAYEAANRRLSWLTDISAREQVVQGIANEVSRGGRTGIADAVLIIDPAPVADDPVGIDDKHLGGPLRAALIGDGVAGVLQNGKVDIGLPRVMRDFGQSVLLVRVNSDERHPLWFILGCQFCKS